MKRKREQKENDKFVRYLLLKILFNTMYLDKYINVLIQYISVMDLLNWTKEKITIIRIKNIICVNKRHQEDVHLQFFLIVLFAGLASKTLRAISF